MTIDEAMRGDLAPGEIIRAMWPTTSGKGYETCGEHGGTEHCNRRCLRSSDARLMVLRHGREPVDIVGEVRP